jgi:hypothetical protein
VKPIYLTAALILAIPLILTAVIVAPIIAAVNE